jgi:thioredoxin-related protein
LHVTVPGRSELLAVAAVLAVLPAAGAQADFDETLSFDDRPAAREIVHPRWFKLSFLDLRADLREAAAAGKTGIVVYFGQENCAYCKHLMEHGFGTPDIAFVAQRKFDVIALDIWGEQPVTDVDGRTFTEREYAHAQQATFTPTLVFYDTSGRIALKLRGYYPPYRLRAAFEYVVAGHYRKESFSEYLARADPPPKFEVGDLNHRDFFPRPPHQLDRSRVAAQRPLVVFFERRDCHACDVLHSEPLSEPELLKKISAFDAVQLDMYADTPVVTPLGRRTTAREWARRLSIFYAPTLVFFDEHGREIFRVDSLVQEYRLGRVLEYVLEKGYASGFDYQQWHGRRRETAAFGG